MLATTAAAAVFVAVLVGAASAFGGQFLRVADRVPEMISLAAQHLTDVDTDSQSVLARAREALQELDRAADSWSVVKARSHKSRVKAGALTAQPGQAAVPVVLAASAPTPISDGATMALKQKPPVAPERC